MLVVGLASVRYWLEADLNTERIPPFRRFFTCVLKPYYDSESCPQGGFLIVSQGILIEEQANAILGFTNF